MAQDSIDKILEAKRLAEKQAEKPAETKEADKFYSILVGEGNQENYLEFKMRDGLCVCLSYTDLSWFSYDPEVPSIELEFGVSFATIKGRGLGGSLWNGIKQKRVAWVKEADTKMQDHPGNELFIEEITFLTKKDEAASAE